MADVAVFIGWGQPVPGRERQALRVFAEVMEYLGRLQQGGEIESFEPVALDPHGGDLEGFVVIRGAREQLSMLRAAEDFQRINGVFAAQMIAAPADLLGQD